MRWSGPRRPALTSSFALQLTTLGYGDVLPLEH
jgi:hypothetical protein